MLRRCAWLLLVAALLVPVAPEHATGQVALDVQRRERRRVLSKNPVIREVNIYGLESIRRFRAISKLHSKVASWYSDLPLLTPSKLRRDSDRLDSLALLSWMLSQGYLDARVKLSYAFIDSTKKNARVDVHLTEGTRTYLRNVQFETPDGPAILTPVEFVKRLKTGEPFNPFILRQVQFDIKEAYANAGYPYALVEADTVLSKDRSYLDLKLTCTPAARVHFGALHIPPQRWTKESAVLREITFRPGDSYSREAILKSEQRLFESGLFDYVSLQSLPSDSKADTLPMFRVRGIERKPLFINIRTGLREDTEHSLVWSSEIEAGDRNFTGTGRQLRASALADFVVGIPWVELKYRVSATYLEPWPLGLRLPVQIEGALEPAILDPLRDYRIRRWEGLMSVLRRQSRRKQQWLTFKYENVDIIGVRPEFQADSGLSVTRSILVGMRRDTRDSPLAPTRGSVTTAKVEYAGGFLGGDQNFIRTEGSWSRYWRIRETWNIIAQRLMFGYLEGTGAEKRVPSQELYFLGGANSVRGFQENLLGPVNVDGQPVGGQLYIVANLELRRPLLGRFWMSAFVDVGNLWSRIDDFALDDWNVGVGAGLHFLSPLGPLRLDYGQRLVQDGVFPPGLLHLSISYAY